MFDDDFNPKNSDNRGQKKPAGGFNVPTFTWVAWIAIVASIVALMFVYNRRPTQAGTLQESEFVAKFEANQIAGALISDSQQSRYVQITGDYLKLGSDGTPVKPPVKVPFIVPNAMLTPDLEEQLIHSDKVTWTAPNPMLSMLWTNLLFFGLIALVFWFFLLRPIKMAGKGALSFGKSKARLLAKERNKITFKDVAGVEEAIEEVSELVEFLKDPKKFQKLGGRIPKGVLMVGPPGTGKTLLAKAIAGEADASFFSISGSDFVEMFVGVGASRVRDMFEQARRNTPCLVFIDEIDAVGRSRGHGLGGGNDEREQTLERVAGRDGRLRYAGRHHHHCRDEPARRAGSGVDAARSL